MSNEFMAKAFQHMAWANSQMFEILSRLSDEAVNLSAWNSHWTVAKIAHHIVVSEGRLISRAMDGSAPEESVPPVTAKGIYDMLPLLEARDAQLLELVDSPERMHTFKRFGEEAGFLTSTILVQAFHHASEHRAQISDILAANGMDVFILDEVDLWHYELMVRNGL